MNRLFFTVLLVLGSGYLLAQPAYGELTTKDMEQIRQIVKEEVQREAGYINRRIDDTKNELNSRINDINNRMGDINNRMGDMNNRMGDMNTRVENLYDLVLGGFGVIFTGIFALIGFVLWDRRTALAPAVRKTKELEERSEIMEKALREYAIQEPKLAVILRGIGLL